jgi:hypothetical protein
LFFYIRSRALSRAPNTCLYISSVVSAIYTYNAFVDILRANIEVIERIKSKYKVAERDININIPSLTARILVIILSSFLVLSKAFRLLLYPFIYLSKVLASVTIILILLVYLQKIFSAELDLRGLLPRRNRKIIFYSKYIFFVVFFPLVREIFYYYYI